MDADVANYFAKQPNQTQQICWELRRIIMVAFPSIFEEMKWGAAVYGKGKFYIAAVRYGVNLGFSMKGLSKVELEFFSGNGKTMRHLKFIKLADIDEQKITKLCKLVYTKS